MNFRRLVKKLIPTNAYHKIEPYGHWLEAIAAQLFYGFPARNLKVIGVTGTDGKTSTVSLITAMMKHDSYKVAMMSTISVDYGDGSGEKPNPTRLTTIGAFPLTKKIKQIKQAGAEWLVLETTSHALAQHRVFAVPYTIAVITNINHEHLDYHGTFEHYLEAKVKLFKQCNRNHRGQRAGVINADDPNANHFIEAIANPLTYGINSGNLKATGINLTASGSSYKININSDSYNVTCHLPGSFNVYNSLAAVAVGRLIGLDQQAIEQGIASLASVEGRMTKVDEGQAFDVIVDYAHTPESFEKIFKEVKPLVKGRLIVLFGSAGRRDEAKRAAQGEIAGKLCDIVIVAEEDDRDIDGQEIMDQIASGAIKAGRSLNRDLYLKHKREDAIKFAFTLAKPGDMVLLLGKGHEKSILTNGPQAKELRHLPQDDDDPRRVTKLPFDEVKVAHETLRQLKTTKSS